MILFIIILLVETTYYPLSNIGVKVLSFELCFANRLTIGTDYYMNFILLFLVFRDYHAKFCESVGEVYQAGDARSITNMLTNNCRQCTDKGVHTN